ncbi:NHL repeat-containing protein [Catalinimonas alkaloidigena]|uniref:NHL repeat-containing protein n=1 Tax=Catalinimonas alkaloidigena TaxID=1075417 RepID=A0A1G8YHX4_9BACT|nr:NHL repeat-containing protein [Catalinimonas alkaloidigena]SDK02004.1 NHL repeat-containing protein [Catalinimonas alkaloidigena]
MKHLLAPSLALLWCATACQPDENMTLRTPDAASVLVTTVAGGEEGYRDGTGTDAQFNHPMDVAVGHDGTLYMADAWNHSVRKIAADGRVSTLAGQWDAAERFADGPAAAARFNNLMGLDVTADGTLYVADLLNNRVRRISPAGEVRTIAGDGSQGEWVDGPVADAKFNLIFDVAVANDGTLYIADTYNHCIRKITSDGLVSTLAGNGQTGFADGTGQAATFNQPVSLCLAQDGTLYVADGGNHSLRKITPDGEVSTLAGSGDAGFADGTGAEALFNGPSGIAISPEGMLYVTDFANHRIRRVTPDGTVSTLAGNGTPGTTDGTGDEAQFNQPEGIAAAGNDVLYVTDTYNNRLRKLSLR